MNQKEVTYMADFKARKMICEIGAIMVNKDFAANNDGSISIKTGPNNIICTPARVSKGNLTPEILVEVDLEGNIITGVLEPSTELSMHLRVYKEDPEMKAVVHAHSPAATAFAVARVPLDQPIMVSAITTLGRVRVSPYATPGTKEESDAIAPYCREDKAVLLANHGALTWGRDIGEAFKRMECLENYARVSLDAAQLGKGPHLLNQEQVKDLIENHSPK